MNSVIPINKILEINEFKPFGFFEEMLNDAELALKANAISSALVSIFVIIDTVSYLSMPIENEKKMQGKKEFIEWVDKYLKTDSDQPYEYNGNDMYGARCAKLHAFSSRSQYSEKNKCMFYCYYTYPDHCIEYPGLKNGYILISVPRLFLDLKKAIILFYEVIKNDAELNNCINHRKDQIIRIVSC